MNEIDEILGTTNYNSNSSTNGKLKYTTNRQHKSNYSNNKNKWKEQQSKVRQEIYDTMDRMAIIVGNDTQKFQKYLDIQSRFSKYSVGNCLVILEKAPNATRIKDESSWNEIGVELVKNPRGIKILEPNKVDGRIYYNPKEVYDITQTNSPKENTKKEYNTRKLLEATLNDCEVPRSSVDKLSNGTLGAEYNKDENVLYVCKGMDKELLFQTLFQEIGNIEMKQEENSDIKSFRSYCISYMLCQKYGIDVSNFDFTNLPEEISSKSDAKEIRGELNIIRSNFENIDARIYHHLEINSKDKNKKEPER